MECCVIDCRNTPDNAIDERTGLPVSMHAFPDPTIEIERCLKWINSCRRQDLTLKDIEHQQVCSVHFDTSAYENPSIIDSSSLLSSAVPILVNLPEQQMAKTSKRKLPTRHKKADTIATDEEPLAKKSNNVGNIINASKGPSPKFGNRSNGPSSSLTDLLNNPPLNSINYVLNSPSDSLDPSNAVLDRAGNSSRRLSNPTVNTSTSRKPMDLETALKEIEQLKKENSLLKRRLERANNKCVNVQLAARKYIKDHAQSIFENMLSGLSEFPEKLYLEINVT